MPKLPPLGKIDAKFFNEVIYPRLGAKRNEVIVGPRHGVDVGIIEFGDEVLAMSADPVFIVPEYGWERAAWFAFHILFSDACTSGLKPAYLAIDLNLPPKITEEQLQIIWQVFHNEAEKYGVAIVTGHTARYGGCDFPMVGGAVAIARGKKSEYVNPKFIEPGDKILITKGPAIEATGIFATMFPKYISQRLGEDITRKAEKLFYKMSIMDDALAAISVGTRDNGVSAMHDATECGLWGGIFEIVGAANLGAKIYFDKIPVKPEVQAVCELFEIDPYKSISEGTLIATVRPDKVNEITEAINSVGVDAAVIGEINDGSDLILEKNGAETKLRHPGIDPFWAAFYGALENYSKIEK